MSIFHAQMYAPDLYRSSVFFTFLVRHKINELIKLIRSWNILLRASKSATTSFLRTRRKHSFQFNGFKVQNWLFSINFLPENMFLIINFLCFLRRGWIKRTFFDFHTFYSFKTLHLSYNKNTLPPRKREEMKTAAVPTEGSKKKNCFKIHARCFQLRPELSFQNFE